MDEQRKRILRRCKGSLPIAGKTFFPNRFTRPFDPLHREIFELIESDHQQVAIAAPRGIGKTSINNLLLPAYHLLFAESKYIVPVSASSDLAIQQAENLKEKLEHSERVEQLFGEIEFEKANKKQWVVSQADQRICVMPRGAGQQIRGILFEDSRPGLIIVDDLEDPDEVMSPSQRDKRKKWFYGDLMGSVDRSRDDWRIIVLGTILHEASLLRDLLSDDHWKSKRLELHDDDFRSNAPNYMDDSACEDLYNEYKSSGELSVYFREYLNRIRPGEEANFQEEHFQYYSEVDKGLDENPKIDNLILVDVARTTQVASSESAIVGVGVDMDSHAIYVRDIVHAKLHPDEIYENIAEMAIRLNARVVGVEVTGLHEFVVHPLQNYLTRAGLHLELIELHARGGRTESGKEERIKQLVPYYRQGLIYHNPQCCTVLENQLLSFPYAEMWDVMDAFAYVIEMLEKGQRYMLPFQEGLVEDKREVEKEFRELEQNQDPMPALTNFRKV